MFGVIKNRRYARMILMKWQPSGAQFVGRIWKGFLRGNFDADFASLDIKSKFCFNFYFFKKYFFIFFDFPQLGSPLWGLKGFFLVLTVGSCVPPSPVPPTSRSGSPGKMKNKFPFKKLKKKFFPQITFPLWGLKGFFLVLTVGCCGPPPRVPRASRPVVPPHRGVPQEG